MRQLLLFQSRFAMFRSCRENLFCSSLFETRGPLLIWDCVSVGRRRGGRCGTPLILFLAAAENKDSRGEAKKRR